MIYDDIGPADKFHFKSDKILATTCIDNTAASIYGTGTVSGSPLSGPVFFIQDLTAGDEDANDDDSGHRNHHATKRLRLFGAHPYDSAQQKVRGEIAIEIKVDNEPDESRRNSGSRSFRSA